MSDLEFENYLTWVKNNGGSFKNLKFEHGSAYATSIIKPNENFASVPFKLCITEDVARQALPNLDNFSSRYVLTLFLLLQKRLGEKSFYWPYINILPKSIQTPFFFDDMELAFLKNTNLEAAVRERRKMIQQNYSMILENLPANVKKEDVKWEEFLYCYCVYSSRSFPYKLIDPSANDSEALFPLVDALNHKPRTKITWSRDGNNENGSLSFIAGQEFKQGEEVFNNYGPKSNEELLLGYGFCFEYNEYDHVALKPNFSQDPNFEVKRQILQQNNISSGNVDPLTFYIHWNNIPAAYFKLMRVLVMNSVEMEHYKQCTNPRFIEFIGYRNELCMLSMTLQVLETKLRAIQSVDLKKDNLRDSQKFALMYRKGDKRSCNHLYATVTYQCGLYRSRGYFKYINYNG
ncbi:hypothetical protein BDF20DRAFT_868834 [Mycotypha africana]|uniref:uncharacterized protein n=1 Tax=Mycotypha africana TaxID=64632 RepID=UPI0023001DD2|nr:uncharacterized protein BDF20DRAFT_868834 [Mycotypha africana]KAI8979311.1 hypothetical protein BDF20DRAFT_868834 [Mycotypha africana]